MKEVQPEDLAAFLRDVMEATTRHQRTIEAQTRDGFVQWCRDVEDLAGVHSPYLARPGDATTRFLEVERPGPAPEPPPVGPDGLGDTTAHELYEEKLGQWRRHKQLYDNLFSARTPPEGMELVVATGLLIGSVEQDRLKRHLLVAVADIQMNRDTGLLIVDAQDAFIQEVNWVPGGLLTSLVADDKMIGDLLEAECHEELGKAVDRLANSLGTQGCVLVHHSDSVPAGQVGIGSHPAVLLRRRNASALLELLRSMADEMATGGLVSDPFHMLVSRDFEPPKRHVQTDHPALPLSADVEQRSMIDRARAEAHTVIQGPPGTGKTHTIANLAAVLIAEGRRVLITAENERALTEVQSKLPATMQSLMLPMFRDRSAGSLEASVNELNRRASSTETPEQRSRAITQQAELLDAIESRIDTAQQQLRAIAQADREERTIDGITMPLEGHLRVLASCRSDLNLVDRYLSTSDSVAPEDGTTTVELAAQIDDDHHRLTSFRFPVGLMEPGELSVWLQEHRGQLATLGDPAEYDYSALVHRQDDLLALAHALHTLPPALWSQITRAPGAYLAAAAQSAALGPAIDHSVTVEPASARNQAIGLLDAYLQLDPSRFDQPIDELLTQHERACVHAAGVATVGEFRAPVRAGELTALTELALQLLARDRSGLLTRYVIDQHTQGWSEVDALVGEARGLVLGSRIPVGLPVEVEHGAPSAHELLRQAEGLDAHLAAGGKMRRLFGAPKPVTDAADLIRYVRIAGSPIDTSEEAARAVEYFKFQKAVALIDSWASTHALIRPAAVSHHEWLTAITELPSTSERVREALALGDALVTFPHGSAPSDPSEYLTAVLATVSKELVDALAPLAVSASTSQCDLRIAGIGIRNRDEATRALNSLNAAETREQSLHLLPSPWVDGCNPLDADGDSLTQRLQTCALAASIPGPARAVDLTPTSVNRIHERAQFDVRRKELLAEREEVIGGLRRVLGACVPMSPATRAIDDALCAENPTDYRLALERLEVEHQKAERATRFRSARERVHQVHPRLITAFETGDQVAERVLEKGLGPLQRLRDYRLAVEVWKNEIGASEKIHERLAELHGEQRRAEQRLAELRAWSRSIERIQSRRELRAALSALSVAMSRVPKTRTAKSYRARLRALQAATREAAPAIPCWVMAIDRVAEVLGYPRGEDRFDVVIVDESSQAWFPAMFLYAIADQVVVVGDDLQTSPSQVVGIDEISAIAHKHLRGHRLADQVGDDLSLYDVAAVMSQPITMIDHFRCAPEIIDLSNRLSYGPTGKRLRPSRVREPGSVEPVKHIKVVGSRQGATGPNQAEVAAIVDQVAQCHANPEYTEMDFGIVVVGTNPIAHIKALITELIETLGPIALDQRNLEVGTPAQFQGAERNVMFLSLVDTPEDGTRLRKWPHEHTGRNRTRVQQLNVAVSRAKDQLWIFHSFDLSALAPDDVRSILLRSPLAARPSLEEQLERCESQFERDVVSALAAADPSLEIRTQVEVIGYRIDVVIEDAQGRRLAVECDGDRWHSADKDIRSDLYRQRTLEDIGWHFHRFLASEWYSDGAFHVDYLLEHLRSLETPKPPSLRSGNVRAPEATGLFLVDERAPQHLLRADEGSKAGTIADANVGESLEDSEEGVSTWEVGQRPGPRSGGSRSSEEFKEPSSRSRPDRPTPEMSSKETNRKLAQAMRDQRIEPFGDAWDRAKRLISAGAGFSDAATWCIDDDATDFALESIMGTQEHLQCEECGATWSRPRSRGRKPQRCPECRRT